MQTVERIEEFVGVEHVEARAVVADEIDAFAVVTPAAHLAAIRKFGDPMPTTAHDVRWMRALVFLRAGQAKKAMARKTVDPNSISDHTGRQLDRPQGAGASDSKAAMKDSVLESFDETAAKH